MDSQHLTASYRYPPKCPVHRTRFVRRHSIHGPFYPCAVRECEWMSSLSEYDHRFRVSNKALRLARMKAHETFDRLWKGAGARFTRDEAYAWLASVLEMPQGKAHIRHFSVPGCIRVIELCRKNFAEVYAEEPEPVLSASAAPLN